MHRFAILASAKSLTSFCCLVVNMQLDSCHSCQGLYESFGCGLVWFFLFLYYSLLPVSRFYRHLTHEFPPTQRICIYTCVQCGHNMSLTTLEVVWQIGSQSILDAFQVYSHLYFYIVSCYLIVISDKKVFYLLCILLSGKVGLRFQTVIILTDMRQYQNM